MTPKPVEHTCFKNSRLLYLIDSKYSNPLISKSLYLLILNNVFKGREKNSDSVDAKRKTEIHHYKEKFSDLSFETIGKTYFRKMAQEYQRNDYN